MDEEREDQETDRMYTEEELWGETGKPVMREPDFSDVRKKILNPWKIFLFFILSAVFWFLYFKFSSR